MLFLPRKSGRHAAIYRENLPCDVTGGRRGEEQHACGDVFKNSNAFGWNSLFDFAKDRIAELVSHFAGDKSGGNRVDGDFAFGDLFGKTARHSDDSGLGSRVVRLARVADQSGDTGDVDDASVTRFHHLFRYRAGEQKSSSQGHSDHVVPLLIGHHWQKRIARDAGVVDEDVDLTPLFGNFVDNSIDGFTVSNVALDRFGLAASIGDDFDRVRKFLDVASDTCDACAGSPKFDRDRAPQSL